MANITVFLDRDGVINRKRPEGDYVKNWGEFQFLPGVKTALLHLMRCECRLFVITNQRGIARGLMSEQDLQSIHAQMLQELSHDGIAISKVYYCPHNKNECTCRKPDIGMLLQAQREYPDIRWEQSYFIGDSVSDVLCGNRMGCKSILIKDDIAPMPVGAQPVFGCALSLLHAVRELIPGVVSH